MSIKFEDNRVEVKEALDEKAIKFLYEAKDSLVSQTQRNTPVQTGDLKRSFGTDSMVDESNLIAYIGSSLEYSIWVELGKNPVPSINWAKSVNKYTLYCKNIQNMVQCIRKRLNFFQIILIKEI